MFISRGDVSHSQIGGTGNVQLNIGESDVVGLFEEIQEYAADYRNQIVFH